MDSFARIYSCGGCGINNIKLKKCPCLTVCYCNKQCQKNHWKNGHKDKCINC